MGNILGSLWRLRRLIYFVSLISIMGLTFFPIILGWGFRGLSGRGSIVILRISFGGGGGIWRLV